MKWYFTYAFRIQGCEDIRFGSVCQAQAEHPIVTIQRWAKERTYLRFALLSFHQVPADLPDLDIEV